MTTATELLRQGKRQEIWEKYCGYFDLSIDQYMAIQRRLLEEQLPRLAASKIGMSIMRGNTPKTLEEFRRSVPFTTYDDYGPFLLNRNEEVLPEKPFIWAHTSGTSGEFNLKWIPYTRRMFEVLGEATMGAILVSSADGKREVVLREGMKIPYLVAPPPYPSGILFQSLMEQFAFTSIPPLDVATKTGFQERIKYIFESGLSDGLDYVFGVTSILLKISENFSHIGKSGGSAGGIRLTPKALLRIAKGFLKSWLRGRSLQAKDIWTLKGMICGGTDTSVLKERVTDAWGVEPLESYAATEYLGIGIQSWTHGGFVPNPELDLWEFISEEDYHKLKGNPSYIPSSHLMNEVQPNTEYVLVGTNFYGGVMTRYIIGDLVKVISLDDKKAGIGLPHFAFVSRIDGLIDVGNFTRLTEKTVWQAIENSGVPYEDWTIRKETRKDEPILHLYLEMQDGAMTEEGAAGRIHGCLKELDQDYRNLEEIAGLKPLRVSLLSKGTFRRYYEERQAAGADLGHLKPAHINATDKVIESLLRMSSWKI